MEENKREQEIKEIEDAIQWMNAEELKRLEAAIRVAGHSLIDEDR